VAERVNPRVAALALRKLRIRKKHSCLVDKYLRFLSYRSGGGIALPACLGVKICSLTRP
jgi:hypothetical protein